MAILKPRTVKEQTVTTATKSAVAKRVAPKKEKTSSVVVTSTQNSTRYADVLLRPHISERASDVTAQGIYTFRVSLRATKPQIKSAVESMYKVNVTHVRVVTIHPKHITVKGVQGTRKRARKAYVHLAQGEKIEII